MQINFMGGARRTKDDLKILRILRENSRESLSVIAEGVGTSKATVSRRITKMEQDAVSSRAALSPPTQ